MDLECNTAITFKSGRNDVRTGCLQRQGGMQEVMKTHRRFGMSEVAIGICMEWLNR